MQFELTTNRHKSTRIYVGKGDVAHHLGIISKKYGTSCFVIIDENVNAIYPGLVNQIRSLHAKSIIGVVGSGESHKSMESFIRLLDTALNQGVKRNTVVYAVGGGVTGDLAGYVAASLLRGLPLVHIPTTLLAMVDSSIGGKTGINHAAGKNLIGAFYQPDHIIMDMDFLETLPQREWNCGLGEILKYGCISDPSILDSTYVASRRRDQAEMADLIGRCARIKTGIVMEDELESGRRAYLNYGHTFAHALESFTGYKRFAHGEAVYVGLVAATRLSQKMGANVDTDKLISHRNTFNLHVSDLLGHIPALINAMRNDKKTTGESLRLVTLVEWGNPQIIGIGNEQHIYDAWDFALRNI